MRGYSQPLPGWRKRQLAKAEAARDLAANERLGNIMGLEEAEEDADTPLGNPQQHAIGREFILAGRAIFTVSGHHSRYTFRVNRKESEDQRYPDPTYFVSVLTGGNNETSYSYVGILDPGTGVIRFTKGSKIGSKAPAAVALTWTMARIWAGKELPEGAAIYHEGRCGRCGRALTVPESIISGFGPDCAERMGR